MQLYVLGVDPGLACGCAEYDRGSWRSWEEKPLPTCDYAWNAIVRARSRGLDVVVSVERFTLGRRRGARTAQPDALKVVGALEWIARRHNVVFLNPGASDAQRIGNRDALRALGWWTPGVDHLNQAAAQVAYACALTRPSEFIELVGPGMILPDDLA